MLQLIAFNAAVWAAIVSFIGLAQAPLFRGATASSVEAARASLEGVWLLHVGGAPSGVFFEMKKRGASYEAVVVRVPHGSDIKKGDRVRLPRDFKASDSALPHHGIWTQYIEAPGFFAERGCCDDRYWISASWDLNGDWTAIEGATGVITIGGVRDRFGGTAYGGNYSGPYLDFTEVADGRFEGALITVPGGARQKATFILTRQDDRAARAQCGGRPRLQLRATYEGGALVLQRCPVRQEFPR